MPLSLNGADQQIRGSKMEGTSFSPDRDKDLKMFTSSFSKPSVLV